MNRDELSCNKSEIKITFLLGWNVADIKINTEFRNKLFLQFL